jgi:hypothetical protein
MRLRRSVIWLTVVQPSVFSLTARCCHPQDRQLLMQMVVLYPHGSLFVVPSNLAIILSYTLFCKLMFRNPFWALIFYNMKGHH